MTKCIVLIQTDHLILGLMYSIFLTNSKSSSTHSKFSKLLYFFKQLHYENRV